MTNLAPTPTVGNIVNHTQVSNFEFLQAIFGDDWEKVHVTAFPDDPTNIDVGRRGVCWAGGIASNLLTHVEFNPAANCNQYFCISTFHPESEGATRRRKELFEATYAIVADDVKSKIPEEMANRLPLPSYRLETSPGNEQWGWILDTPCTSREQVENLLNGLISQGLSPDGKDPGMKGVTRYVRLPEGSNTKAKYRKADGSYPRCRIISWNPERRTTLQQLAEPFNIDLDKPCTSMIKSIETPENAAHHPLFQALYQHAQITSAPNNGWYGIKDCPNSAEHSTSDTSGAAIIINTDGTFGFKCHHGHCSDEINAYSALELWDMQYPGVKQNVEEFIAEAQRQDFQAQLQEQSQNNPGPSSSGVNGYKQKLADFFGDPGIVQLTGQSSNEIISRYLVKVMHGGKSMVGYTVRDPVSGNLSLQITRSVELENLFSDVYAFNENANIIYAGRSERSPINAIKYWMSRPGSKTYNAITFEPIPNTYTSQYNIISDKPDLNYWMGFAVTPIPGACDLIKSHIFNIWCNGNEDIYWYVYRWLARMIQHPELRAETAIVLRSGEGAGKNIIIDVFVKCFGCHGVVLTNSEHLAGRFNNHLAKSVLVFSNEAIWGGDKAKTGSLKSLITDETLTIEEKYKDVITVPNRTHLMMATNNNWAIPAGMDDRRYLLLDLSESRKGDSDYFQNLAAEIHNGGIEAFLNELNTFNLSGFNHRDIPRNQGATKLMDQLKTDIPLASWWFDTLNSPDSTMFPDQTGFMMNEWDEWINGNLQIGKDDLHRRYLNYCTTQKIARPSDKSVFFRDFNQLFNHGLNLTYTDLQKRADGNRVRMVRFTDLVGCRQAFCKVSGRSEYDWDEPT